MDPQRERERTLRNRHRVKRRRQLVRVAVVDERVRIFAPAGASSAAIGSPAFAGTAVHPGRSAAGPAGFLRKI